MSALSSKRILITRPRAQAAELGDQLAALGAEPILFPTIEIAPLADYAALDQALAALDRYHWVIFTSVNGVAAVWKRLELFRLQSQISNRKMACIGPATAQALAKRGVRARFIPHEYVAEAVIAGLGDVRGQRILLPQAELAREALADELGRRGAAVHAIPVYRTLPAAPDPHGLAALRRGVDAITFTSSSTVRNFVRLLSGGPVYTDAALVPRLGPDGLPMPSLDRAITACLGPITAQTARDAGLPVDVMARDYTLDGLVAALSDYFAHPELQLKENRWILAR